MFIKKEITTPAGYVVRLTAENISCIESVYGIFTEAETVPANDWAYDATISAELSIVRDPAGRDIIDGITIYSFSGDFYARFYPLVDTPKVCDAGRWVNSRPAFDRHYHFHEADNSFHITTLSRYECGKSYNADSAAESKDFTAAVDKFVSLLGVTHLEFWHYINSVVRELCEDLFAEIAPAAAADYAQFLGAEVVKVRPNWLPYFFNSDCGDMSAEEIAEADQFNDELIRRGYMPADKMEKLDPDNDGTSFDRPSFIPAALPGECEEWLAFPSDYIEVYKRANGEA
jgi:hypothetical protein